ncbi:MAG: PHP domain-containing protein [Clostridia bacterium]|nr:PHP domain-containing protein [Clostridia bacterium]
MKCDLHLHTTCSDGILTPEQLVDKLIELGMHCIAISDHDTVAGVQRAIDHAKGRLQILPCVELSATEGEKDVHILAYNVDYTNQEFLKKMQKVAQYRHLRNVALEKRLNEYGIEISLDEITAQKVGNTVGRNDFAKKMVQMGLVENESEAFEKYLGTNAPCFVRTERLSVEEAIKLTRDFGGIPVLAHPKLLRMTKPDFEKYLLKLHKARLGGIEAEYFSHTYFDRKYYTKLAKKYSMVVTGGSDFHDGTHGVGLGKSFSPMPYTKKVLKIK